MPVSVSFSRRHAWRCHSLHGGLADGWMLEEGAPARIVPIPTQHVEKQCLRYMTACGHMSPHSKIHSPSTSNKRRITNCQRTLHLSRRRLVFLSLGFHTVSFFHTTRLLSRRLSTDISIYEATFSSWKPGILSISPVDHRAGPDHDPPARERLPAFSSPGSDLLLDNSCQHCPPVPGGSFASGLWSHLGMLRWSWSRPLPTARRGMPCSEISLFALFGRDGGSRS